MISWRESVDQLKTGEIAPDFTLMDSSGQEISLSVILQESNALLVFNIGFA